MRDLETYNLISGSMRGLETNLVILGPMRGLKIYAWGGDINTYNTGTDIETTRLTQPRRPSQ